MKNTLLFFAMTMVATLIPVKAKTLYLTNVNVVDVETLQLQKNQLITIKDDLIVSVGKMRTIKQNSDAIIVDMKGKYAIPGLIDTHVHHATDPDAWDNATATKMRLQGLLRGGVTSVRDMGGDNRALAFMKRNAEIDVIQSPDIYYSVIIGGQEFFSDPRTVSSAKGRVPGQVDWMRAVDIDSNFDEVMLRAAGTGATGIKIYAKVPADVVAKLTAAAKKHGLKVWSHVFIGPARPIDTVNAGVETISHAPDISAHTVENFYQLRRQNKHISEQQKVMSLELQRYQDLFQAMKQQGSIFDPTLTIFGMREGQNERADLMWQWGKMFTKEAHNYGIKIATGTDGASDLYGIDYPLVHKEMALLVAHADMTPIEAIQAATINSAEVIGIEDTTGSISANKKANLVVLNQDPTIDIAHSKDIAHVIKNGQFIYRGNDKNLPFSAAREASGMLWMSGNLGNLPSTMTLAGSTLEQQMVQTMENIGDVLQEYNLTYDDVTKCTLMLADIKDWPAANKVYVKYFKENAFPARSAFAASGLALNAKIEVECIAKL
ncbi:amidohydrolase family protein [Thalassotalea agarivorans]|uniref:Reactive intermediate/imine deaminase n=1 Tax=Thalassotalea agarivorans TaxID=349064 RepID=A0A1I0DPJ3_THASX|nr:amidohydrolase family protein [Thalassotalea agarivorans]SET34296.1 reactive intermediate/imine deaminase [Thalassotalea agarivorans]